MAEEKKLEGLGGWLVLVGIGVILSPLRIISGILPSYINMLSDGTWAALTTPGAVAYNSLWAPIFFGELAINCSLVLAWIFTAFLFFSKKKSFPKWYICVMLFTLLFIPLDAMAIQSIFPDKPIFDDETTKEFGRSLSATLIWVPYMLISKRVKATFVK